VPAGEGTARWRKGGPEVRCEKLGERSLADGGGGRRKPALGPRRDRREHWLECTPACGQSIAHPHRRSRVDETLDDALCFELAKTFGQHSVADARDAREQLIEASRCRDESFDHRPGPAFPDQLDRALKGRAVVEAPSDHGERFYAVSQVSERTRLVFSTGKFFRPQSRSVIPWSDVSGGLGKLQVSGLMRCRWS